MQLKKPPIQWRERQHLCWWLWPLSSLAKSCCFFNCTALYVFNADLLCWYSISQHCALLSLLELSVSSFSIWNVMESDSTHLFYPLLFICKTQLTSFSGLQASLFKNKLTHTLFSALCNTDRNVRVRISNSKIHTHIDIYCCTKLWVWMNTCRISNVQAAATAKTAEAGKPNLQASNPPFTIL